MRPPGQQDSALPPIPPSPPSAPPSLADDLKEIQRYGSLVLLFASLPFITLPGLIAKLTHFDEILGIWQLVANTAPLTLAVIAVGIAILSGKYGVGELVVGTGFALLASLIIGDALGRTSPVDLTKDLGGLPVAIFNILGGYLRLYGFWSFATSFVVGGFLAWAWSKKLGPRIAGRSPRP